MKYILFINLSLIWCINAFKSTSPSFYRISSTYSKLKLFPDIHESLIHTIHNHQSILDHFSMFNADLLPIDAVGDSTTAQAVVDTAASDVSPYAKIDKTGFIGFIATYVEIAIDFGHSLFEGLGIKNTYGFSIILFTMLVKALTLPLITTQLESTSKMQKLQPYQQKIQAKYANDESTKNQLIAQLFQAAEVNPLAGCFPALVQIPVFLSLYRALQNLVAENKLSEPFLWIPDLEGPTYGKPTSQSMDWLNSILTGNPILGWHDTLCFLSIPLILYISQTISTKALQPPRDPNKVLTEQEQFSQGLINNLPLIVAFFSINVPAGLGVYWIVNNIFTTGINVAIKNSLKDDKFPPEVTRMMALIDGGGAVTIAAPKRSSIEELNRDFSLDERPKSTSGFGSSKSAIVDVEEVTKEDDSSPTIAEDKSSSEIEKALIVDDDESTKKTKKGKSVRRRK
eukprot:gene5688-7852_t